MNSKNNDIDKLFKKFNINVTFKNNNALKNEFLFAKTNVIKTNYVETFDNDKPIMTSIYPSNVNYGKDVKNFTNQPIHVKCSDQGS
uniref:Uncharacterized protein n=1 Tax=Strongyloides venezuelensis TaxID=75913 RepID=A0A0K0G5F2_STRVS